MSKKKSVVQSELFTLMEDVAGLKADMGWVKKLIFITATSSIGTLLTIFGGTIVHALKG